MASGFPLRKKRERTKLHNSKPYERQKISARPNVKHGSDVTASTSNIRGSQSQSWLWRMASTVKDIFIPSWLMGSTRNSLADEDDLMVEENTLRWNESTFERKAKDRNNLVSEKNEEKPFSQSEYASQSSKNLEIAGKSNYLISNQWQNLSKHSSTNQDEKDYDENEDFSLQKDADDPCKVLSEASDLAVKRLSTKGHEDESSHLEINGDDQSDNSEESGSTSGCSSLLPSGERHHGVGLQLSEAALERIRKELSEKRDSSERSKRKDVAVETDINNSVENSSTQNQSSLWTANGGHLTKRLAKPQATVRGQRPSFSMSSFGTPVVQGTTHSTLESSLYDSPFYQGKTTYGGASAYRRVRFLSSLPYQSPSSYGQVKVREAKAAKEDLSYMSATSKRILQTLEKMSTPLSDAKKIPTERKAASEMTFKYTPSNLRRRPLLSCRNFQEPLRGPPVSNIHTPAPVMKGRNLESHVKITRDEKYAVDKTSNLARASSLVSEGGGKMKVQKRNNRHVSSRVNEEEQAQVIENQNLPNIVLPITTLPKFNFTIPTPVPNTTASVAVTTGSPGFIFSAPIQYSVPSTLSGAHSSQEDRKFTFSSPMILDNSTNTPESPFKKQTVSVEPSEGFKKSQLEGVAGSGIRPSSDLIVGGSVMDVLKKTQTSIPVDKPIVDLTVESTSVITEEKSREVGASISPSNTSRQASNNLQTENPLQEERLKNQGFGEKFKPDPGSWECSVCMLRNKSGDFKCIACESPKLGAGHLTQNSGFLEKFKPSPGSWECSTCMVRNKPNDLKCVACTTSKPGSGFKTSTPQVTATGFEDKFKAPPGSWPCPTCMINNKSSVSRCAACETPKPGSLNQASKATVSGFNDKFKPAAGSWECDTCLIRNKPDSLRCVACETPRASDVNAKEKKETFSGFKFGTSVSSSSLASTFKFVSPSDSGNINTTTKCNFNFFAPTTVTASSTSQQLSFSFSTPVITTSCTTTESKFGFPVTNANCTTTKYKFGAPVTNASCTTTEFMFGLPSSNKEISTSSGIHITQESVSSKTNSTEETITSISSKPTDAASVDKTSASSLTVTSVTTQQTKLSFGLPLQATMSGQVSQTKQSEFGSCINKENKAVGGFSFPLNKLSAQDNLALSKPEEKPMSGFSFGAPSVKKEENTSLVFSSTKNENLLMTSTTPVAPSFGFLDKTSTSVTGSSLVPSVPVFTMNTEKKDPEGSCGANFFFGNSSGMNSSSKPATFSFGGTTTTTSVLFGSTASTSLFTFGSQGPATLAFGGQSSSGAPTFGSATLTPKLDTIDSVRTPTFGAVSSVPKLGVTFPSEKPAFKLESSETPSKVPGGVPTFGVGVPAHEASSNVPLFGQPLPEPKPSLSNNSASGFNVSSTPTFQFGLSSAQPSGVFRFGTPQVPGASTQETSFSFGSPVQLAASVAPTPSFFNSNVAPFGFSTPTPSFQPTSSENPFSVSANNKNPPRKIRRAVRRTARK
ncbi:uncharacterized protein LOC143235521 isoform X2 [Tachypleus tridentatus]|uniref:uncharacterized protein LOC143235521 isoform X2 n=2 Tax=Tachypleus tridentatus TaxID=6853 RepID=UPI003FCF2463